MSGGNTTCKTTSLDWYTSTVGETPCQTYQQLRQICNAGYTVGSLSTSTPGDRCNDQLASCCCNSVAFALSMLCLNCQQGVGTGINGDTGYDAGVGAYQIYLGNCSPNTNQSLPNDVQSAVCNEKLKIDDDLYTLFWGDGSWYYIYTRETIQKDQQAKANNTYTHCNSTTITTSNSTNTNTTSSALTTMTTAATVSPTASPVQIANNTKGLTAGPISGIAVGAVVAVVSLIGLIFWFLRRRRRRQGSTANHVYNYSRPEMQPIVEPFTSFSSDGTSAVLNSQPFLVPSDSSSTQPYVSSRITKGRLPVESRPEAGSVSLSTLHTPTSAASVSQPPNASLLTPSQQFLEAFPERHVDAGPVLERSPSGRLPPAYGEQLVNI